VQARRWFVEDVDAAAFCHVRRELESLPLAAGERRQRLTDREVAEPDVSESFEDRVCGGCPRLAGAEEGFCLRDGHREDLADITPAEVVVEYVGLEPLATADSHTVSTVAMIPSSV
jgi:hypothetical protein